MTTSHFWDYLARLVATSELVIDRPRGSAHPRYPDMVYPLDYGYLAGTTASDGGGIDVWVGSAEPRTITAIVCTVDLLKRDTEIKILLGCTPDEQQTILAFHTSEHTQGWLVPAPPPPSQ